MRDCTAGPAAVRFVSISGSTSVVTTRFLRWRRSVTNELRWRDFDERFAGERMHVDTWIVELL